TRRRLYGRGRSAPDELPSRLPGVLRARRRRTRLGEVGHLRVFTFLVPDAGDFLDEVVRLLEALPQDGLVLDVRGNGATDILAAGFQDHDVGPVLGTAANTGAGGANVWSHELLRRVLAGGAGAAALDELPQRAGFRVALRRTTRVGARAGTPLEDLGVV